MSFSYDSPGDSDKDTVRFLLQDTNQTEAFLTDEEIQYAINQWLPIYGSLSYVAASLADTISGRYAREASYSADGVSISLGPVGEQYRALAALLREQHKSLLVGGLPDAGGITPGEQLDHLTRNFSFGTGMHDDIEAGPQDYGARDAQWYNAHEYPGV